MLASLAAAPAAFASPTIDSVVLHAPATAETGEQIELSLIASGGADLYAYEVEITYDPLLAEPVSGGEAFPSGGFDTALAHPGAVTLSHTRLGASPGLDGDVAVATLAFTALAPGAASFSPSSLVFVGVDGEQSVVEVAPVEIDIVGAGGGDSDETPPEGETPDGEPAADDDGPAPDRPSPDEASDDAAIGADDEGDLAVTGIGMGGVTVLIVIALVSVGIGAALVRLKVVNA